MEKRTPQDFKEQVSEPKLKHFHYDDDVDDEAYT